MTEMYWRFALGRERSDDDAFQIGRRLYLALDDFSKTFNHSCDPTSGFKNETDLFALRDIRAGEEITYDYSTTVSPDIFWWKMPCACGALRCRKTLRPADKTPKDIINEYDEKEALPKFVKLKKSILFPAFLLIITAPVFLARVLFKKIRK